MSIKTALLSVSDKTNLLPLARGLQDLGFRLLSTGGTAALLKQEGLLVTQVSDYTGFPEIMAGRVKTLHPKIHGGILGRRDTDADVMTIHNIEPIDVVVVNLYPFLHEPSIEHIDVGGPAMIRAAAKNHAWVKVVVDPADYDTVLRSLAHNTEDAPLHRQLAAKAFAHTAHYDAAIAAFLAQGKNELPEQLTLSLKKHQTLRYGENPHQTAALYLNPHDGSGLDLARAQIHQGLTLSYNNLLDADAALGCIRQFEEPACVIVKHGNPCGVGLGHTLEEAYTKAYACDPTSAFGGILAFNHPIEAPFLERLLAKQFIEVIVAPSFSSLALEAACRKPNIRLLSTGPLHPETQASWEYHRISGGLLVQNTDYTPLCLNECRLMTTRKPTPQEEQDAWFSWQICRFVKSNAIVLSRQGQTLGIGAGQMSRVMSTRIARWQAEERGFSLAGASLASDAFFPFKDSIETAAEAGITCIIQPGGSKRDAEVIAAANEHGIAMLFTGIRYFKHA